MPGSLAHLASRFFDYLRARPLNEQHVSELGSWLTVGQLELFLDQTPRDQAHGYAAGSIVVANGVSDIEAVRAALLHDVGKRHAGLGVFGRSFASLLIKSRMPLTRAMRTYRDHGDVGSTELAAVGSSPLVVDFARNHHGTRPETIDEGTWNVLQGADRPGKPSVLGTLG